MGGKVIANVRKEINKARSISIAFNPASFARRRDKVATKSGQKVNQTVLFGYLNCLCGLLPIF